MQAENENKNRKESKIQIPRIQDMNAIRAGMCGYLCGQQLWAQLNMTSLWILKNQCNIFHHSHATDVYSSLHSQQFPTQTVHTLFHIAGDGKETTVFVIFQSQKLDIFPLLYIFLIWNSFKSALVWTIFFLFASHLNELSSQ